MKKRIPGFGTVYRRGGIWWIGYSVRGKWFRESSHSDREADAIRLLKERWKSVGKGKFIGPQEERVTVDQLLGLLETDYQLNGRRSTPGLAWKLHHLRAFFSRMRAIEVTEEKIEKYKAARLEERTWRGGRTKPATINRELAALRRAFRLGLQHKLIASVPSVTMLEENNVRMGFVEPREFARILTHLPELIRDFAQFAYRTGWRRGEIESLRWADVNREQGRIILRAEYSKNKEARILPLAGTIAEIIERRWQARTIRRADGSTALSEYVFHRGDGRRLGDFRRQWKSACAEAGFPNLLFHDLRRSAVRNFDRSGVPQAVGMLLSGHKTASVYRRYRIVDENDLRQAIEHTEAAMATNANQRILPFAEAKAGQRQ